MRFDGAEDKKRKCLLFWLVYTHDKIISLRLGRASTIQDYDIDLPISTMGEYGVPPLGLVMQYWLEVTRIQGQVYELLYSPAALHKSDAERAQVSASLQSALHAAYSSRIEADRQIRADSSMANANPTHQLLFMLETDMNIHYSTLTLAQHATRVAGQGVSPALDSARCALRVSCDFSRRLGAKVNEYFWTMYCHW